MKKICFDNGVTKPKESIEKEQSKIELTRGDSEGKESLRRSQRRSTSTKLTEEVKPGSGKTQVKTLQRNKIVPERVSTRKKGSFGRDLVGIFL